ncbi:MAG: bifunctional 3'-5' exonuclease/DNA polymerase [Rothia sp. (in: high G+C Gram-positive bacteria)]|uniref:bifunctional 3'-5' exonuclease/DNA polymerase n=1 Tax=Rothia sp. (in: high G+C Gram-positive bacteria) TaxID=1885016 RepID=UPI0026E03C92|nr:bifunctional 3'-5' exonuclease/DNA polymerase [Rothia sp. (in: high G+C Gram-positive bacteria)]MDO5749880.1 bifunctional 3'-5' exonuclease/DNA polymerase [Rothia sp. (in: high G+C Gram-positive bacteria)]
MHILLAPLPLSLSDGSSDTALPEPAQAQEWAALHCEISDAPREQNAQRMSTMPTPQTLEFSALNYCRIVRADKVPAKNLARYIERAQAHFSASPQTPSVRWAWADSRTIMPLILAQDTRPLSCHDMRLAQRILAQSATHPSGFISYSPVYNLQRAVESEQHRSSIWSARQIEGQEELFGDDFFGSSGSDSPGSHAVQNPLKTENNDSLYESLELYSRRNSEEYVPSLIERLPSALRALLAELVIQLQAIASSAHPARMALLIAAESSGALVAAEIAQYGLPFSSAAHNAHLEELLGPKPAEGQYPRRLNELTEIIRARLYSPNLRPASAQELLKALQAAGVRVNSVRKYELLTWAEEKPDQAQARHALIDPILEFKKLYRIFTANGWGWAEQWVQGERFRPLLEVGGAATGRWGASGGGALQLPAEIRGSIIAPEHYSLLVADGSQIEPRILAALSRDEHLAQAARGADLYSNIASLAAHKNIALTERAQAKIGMLAIMYGGRSGEIGALLPHIAALFPAAMDFTERAARIGEAGGQVTTFLGRTSPVPDERWWQVVNDQSSPQAASRAVSARASFGRMTRNFVVQGTAAEWALCWMGLIRTRLLTECWGDRPFSTKLLYFLHDEVLLCGPDFEMDRVEHIVRESAARAAELIFGRVPVDFPLSCARVKSYDQAK